MACVTGVQRHDSAVMDRHVLLDDALTAAQARQLAAALMPRPTRPSDIAPTWSRRPPPVPVVVVVAWPKFSSRLL